MRSNLPRKRACNTEGKSFSHKGKQLKGASMTTTQAVQAIEDGRTHESFHDAATQRHGLIGMLATVAICALLYWIAVL
jgi:hypothetical protein